MTREVPRRRPHEEHSTDSAEMQPRPAWLAHRLDGSVPRLPRNRGWYIFPATALMHSRRVRATPQARTYSGRSQKLRSSPQLDPVQFADKGFASIHVISRVRCCQCPWNPETPYADMGRLPHPSRVRNLERTVADRLCLSENAVNKYSGAMKIHRSWRLLIVGVTSAAVMISAIVPSVVQASSAAAGRPWADLCLSRGSTEKAGQSVPDGQTLQKCSSCPLHAPPVLAPPLVTGALKQASTENFAVHRTSADIRPERRWAPARSRAPPFL